MVIHRELGTEMLDASLSTAFMSSASCTIRILTEQLSHTYPKFQVETVRLEEFFKSKGMTQTRRRAGAN